MDIPEVVQATFYTMIAAYVEELSVLPAVMGGAIEEALGNLYWFSFEGWLDIHKKELLSTSQRALTAGAAAASQQLSDDSAKSVGLNDVPINPGI